jgi:uncharacterized damage-inducible protein DinB
MICSPEKSIEILEKTPDALFRLLENISPEWTSNNEGADSWSVFDVMGHLIHGDKTDWMTRMMVILSNDDNKAFTSFDRHAQSLTSQGKNLRQLLNEFKEIRHSNIETLRSLRISPSDLNKVGIHPVFGEVTLSQLLATWVVHDLDHIAQISRVMAKQYKEAVGPWIEYLKILRT